MVWSINMRRFRWQRAKRIERESVGEEEEQEEEQEQESGQNEKTTVTLISLNV